MQKQVSDVTIRNNAFKEGGVFIPNSVLTNPHLTQLEKIIYAHVLALNVNGRGCYQSTFYIAAKLGCSSPSVKRSIYKLLKVGLFKRVQKGESNRIRELYCCQFISDETIDEYKLDQNDPAEVQYDPNDDQTFENLGINLIQKEDHSDPDKIPYKKPNIIYNITTKPKDPTLHSEKTEAEEANAEASVTTPSKKSSVKKVSPDKKPRPSEGCTVMMTDAEWNTIVKELGLMCVLYLCDQFEHYDKKAKYKDHYRTLVNWNQRELGKRKVFAFKPKGGWAYYDQYTKDLVFEGDDK